MYILTTHKRKSISLFADDTAIYYSGTSIKEIEEKFDVDLAKISIFIKTNGLALNVKKTEFMVIGTWQKLKHCDPNECQMNGKLL